MIEEWYSAQAEDITFEDMLFLFSPIPEAKYPFALTERQHAVLRRRVEILGGKIGDLGDGEIWMGNAASTDVAILGAKLCGLLMRLCDGKYRLGLRGAESETATLDAAP